MCILIAGSASSQYPPRAAASALPSPRPALSPPAHSAPGGAAAPAHARCVPRAGPGPRPSPRSGGRGSRGRREVPGLPPPENVSAGAGGCWSRRRHLPVPARLLLPCSLILLSCPPPGLPLPPPPGGEWPPGREGRGPYPGSAALLRGGPVQAPTSGAWAG